MSKQPDAQPTPITCGWCERMARLEGEGGDPEIGAGVIAADPAEYRWGFEDAKQAAMDILLKLSADASAHASKPDQPHSWHEAFTRDAECYDEARDLIRAMEPSHAR